MWIKEIQIIITRHAKRRMIERGCDPEEVRSFLQRLNYLDLLRNHRGIEITVPLKGRLVGVLNDTTLIVKSFLWPPRCARDYYQNFRKSGECLTVRVASVSFLDGTRTPATQRRTG